MKRLALVAAGAFGGLLAGLVLSLLAQYVGTALGLDDPRGGQGTSLFAALGLVVLSISIVSGAALGYKIGIPGPDPIGLRKSRRYINWMQGYRTSETRESSSQKSGDEGQPEL